MGEAEETTHSKRIGGQLQGSSKDDDLYGGAWCAEPEENNHWFEVDARREVEFTGIITQGRNSEQQWVQAEPEEALVDVMLWCSCLGSSRISISKHTEYLDIFNQKYSFNWVVDRVLRL